MPYSTVGWFLPIMRRLLLFRHSKAERSEPGRIDHARALTEHGRADAALIGAYMARHALVPDRALVSPAARTAETWQHAVTAFSSAPATAADRRIYDASPQALAGLIKETPDSVHTLLVVGHNPGLQELALLLIATGDIETRERLREKLPTSGLAIIDFAFDDWTKLHPHSGRLERFVSPKSLAAATN
jgi:phosphohistidine phosphatase